MEKVLNNLNFLEAVTSEDHSPLELCQWLRNEFINTFITRFNNDDNRRKLALYNGEVIPTNERNLTDVRNRVSLIIEYELAKISNQILKEDYDIDQIFWSYVVANRFPDLEVLDNFGNKVLRVEVKCLQSISEEKSANFDTLKKDLNDETDYLMVFLWEWDYEKKDVSWDRAPKILDAFIFHAYSLATFRDQYWLNKPPSNLGNGFQGFDLRHAVNCVDGVFSVEEGNYGKLLRIWNSDFEFKPKMTPLLIDTEKEYQRLKSNSILSGFESLSRNIIPKLSKDSSIIKCFDGYGYYSGEFIFYMGKLGSSEVIELMLSNGIKYLVQMNEKYVSNGFLLENKSLKNLFSKSKPKMINLDKFNLS